MIPAVAHQSAPAAGRMSPVLAFLASAGRRGRRHLAGLRAGIRTPSGSRVPGRPRLSTETLESIGWVSLTLLAIVAFSLVNDVPAGQSSALTDKGVLILLLLGGAFLQRWFHASQLGWIISMCDQLHRGGVIKTTQLTCPFEEFEDQLIRSRHERLVQLVVTALAALSLVPVWLILARPMPDDPLSRAYALGSLSVHQFVWGLLYVLVVLDVALAVGIAIRLWISASAMSKLFAACEIVPQPYHPDQCNGLAAIGHYILRNAGLITVLGLAVIAVVVLNFTLGSTRASLSADDVLLFTGIYAGAIYLFVLRPVRQAHSAMADAKERVLEQIAVHMRRALEDPDVDRVAATFALVRRLEGKYKLLDRQYRTWPFAVPVIPGVSLVTLTPLVAGLISAVVEKASGLASVAMVAR